MQVNVLCTQVMFHAILLLYFQSLQAQLLERIAAMSNVARRPLLMEKEKAHALKMFEPEIMDRSVNRDQVMVMFGHAEPVWFFCYGWVHYSPIRSKSDFISHSNASNV